MADTTLSDVYDDPDNILADTDDSVDGASAAGESIFTPERGHDDRGAMEMTDSEAEDRPGGSRADELDSEDFDADRLADVISGDEQDGTNS